MIVPTPSSPAPTNSSPATGSNAISDVLIERISVWLTARFAASENVIREPASRSWEFSATLSYTTTVSYSEKPRMVSRPTTVDGVTSNPTSEYTPADKMRSCSKATMPPTAILHWNRIEM